MNPRTIVKVMTFMTQEGLLNTSTIASSKVKKKDEIIFRRGTSLYHFNTPLHSPRPLAVRSDAGVRAAGACEVLFSFCIDCFRLSG